MEKLFVSTLIMPYGCPCKFLVQRITFDSWDFRNQNIDLTIHIYKTMEGCWSGVLSTHFGNKVQDNNLICQAIFELRDFYKKQKTYYPEIRNWIMFAR